MYKLQSQMLMSCRTMTRPTNQMYQIQCPVKNGENLYFDKKTADVYFSFSSADTAPASSTAPAAATIPAAPTQIPAHRILLANQSDVFKSIFYGDTKEDGIHKIPITDVDGATFKEFLQFFYLINVELHVENIVGLMYLGHKFKVTTCIDVCVQFLKDIVTVDNILETMNLAITYNIIDLMEFCDQFIVLNSHDVIESSSFLECEHQTLAHVISQNLLACSEVKLFELCMAWVKAKNKQDGLTKEIVEDALGDLFYEIRYGSMSIQEFCNLVMKYDAVLSNDFKTITKMIVLPDYQPEKFRTRPRQIKMCIDTCLMECNRIDQENGQEFTDCGADEAFDPVNFKRKKETVFSTNNKRIHLIRSTYGQMQPHDSYSSDDDDDENQFPPCKMPRKMISQRKKQVE